MGVNQPPVANYKNHRFPPEIIARAVWLYYRFPLSLRHVEEMLLERGITVSYETIRRWGRKHGPDYARRIRRKPPSAGMSGNRTLRVGQYVQAGTQLMAVVPLGSVYIVANYKETQLRDVRPGQPVDIEVDMLSGMTFRGHVDSIAPASGQAFALLPPDNATGNFTKIVQRIPVRIHINDFAGHEGALRPGMSLETNIDTKGGR